MDVRFPSPARFAPLTASWGGRQRERREEDVRRARAATRCAEPQDETPLGPAMSFMAHVAGQTGRDGANLTGAAIYAAARRPRFACGVCADERA